MLPSHSFYNAIASEYKTYCESSRINDCLEKDVALVESCRPKSILEFGVGDGRFARAYIQRNKSVMYVGVDNSEEMILQARDSGALLILEDFNTYIQRMVEEGTKYDCIIAPYTAIHHVETLQQSPLFENMKQVTSVIIINCLSKKKEEDIFNNGNETEITFTLPNGNVAKTVVYKLHETIRKNMTIKTDEGSRENVVWTR